MGLAVGQPLYLLETEEIQKKKQTEESLEMNCCMRRCFFFFFPGSSGRGKDQPYTGHHRSMIAIAFQLHGTLKQQEGMKQHAVKLHSNNSLKTSMNDNQSKSLEMWCSIEQQTFKFGRITI